MTQHARLKIDTGVQVYFCEKARSAAGNLPTLRDLKPQATVEA